MKKRSVRIVAVIDIGSNNIKMRISQRSKGVIGDLEMLERPVGIGHEVFSTGKISFDCLREISKIIQGFSRVMEEYGVGSVRVVATTALRECQNRAYVTDQLKIQNDITLEILEETQEKSLIYSEIMRQFRERELTDFGNTLISYIGTGSIGIAACSHGNIVLMQNIRIGSVKLHDILAGMEEITDRFDVVAEEYLDTLLSDIGDYIEKKSVKELILSGSEFDVIARHCQISSVGGTYKITGKEIEALYDQIKGLSAEELCERYEVTEAEGEEFYAVLAIYDRLLKLTGAQRVYYTKIDVWDPIMRQMLLPAKGGDELELSQNTLASAGRIAKKYQCNREHYDFVVGVARDIFDKTKKFHGMGAKYRLFLELATILHDCGHFISTKNHLTATYDVIKNSEIYGLTRDEQHMIANVAKHNESSVPDLTDTNFRELGEKQQLIVSKLVGIFRVASALDKSYRQKIETVKIKLEGQKLVVAGITDHDTFLEQWAFRQCAAFFEDVFGIKPVFELKTKLL